ncbi:hypothetical protein OG264_03060 [Streptomyces xanthophaeus]|uniref:hypothetical protein n=1 Tax=Streptomyces xanthophaeus TaxID=67385 RepID=UPI0038688C70|nr:hypothetical protein OG264_03060 [Streptomyces xanthophaeus]WST64446.1 hypothetical protein OG605_35300 [Streptomyces xanthophaeus]
MRREQAVVAEQLEPVLAAPPAPPPGLPAPSASASAPVPAPVPAVRRQPNWARSRRATVQCSALATFP